MNFNWLIRRNRFKNKPEEPTRRLGSGRSSSSSGANTASARRWSRSALAMLGALLLALDRPVHTISMDGSFQRVSPGQIEKAVAPYAHAGLSVRGSRRHPERGRGTALGRSRTRSAALAEQPARHRGRADGRGALGRFGPAQHARRAVRDDPRRTCPRSCRACPAPTGTESQVAQRYLSAQGRVLEAGMRIAALRLDERGAWEMDLDSGVTVRLGRRDVDERIDRFIRTASQVIAHRMTEITYVDMRYSNGFAIGWRNAAQTPATPPSKHSDDSDA